MGKHIGISLVFIFLLFFLPWLWGEPSKIPETTEAESGEPEREEEPDYTAAGAVDSSLILHVLVDGQLQEMDMGTYLMGVVRA